MARKSEIKITINLDDSNVPERISWKGTEESLLEEKDCEAVILSMWDKEERNSLILDIWTQKMEVGEMNAHFFYTILQMADTYERATNDKELSNKIRDFANDFADSVKEFAKKED